LSIDFLLNFIFAGAGTLAVDAEKTDDTEESKTAIV
jgi:hypothetical protein